MPITLLFPVAAGLCLLGAYLTTASGRRLFITIAASFFMLWALYAWALSALSLHS
jgi:hypothetical protein